MEIGAQLYTIRDYAKTPDDIKNSFKKIADIGYKNIQVSGLGEIKPEELKYIADENNLKIVVTHINQDRLLNDLESVIKEHEIFECTGVGIGSMPQKYRENAEGYRCFIKDYNVVAKRLNDVGMKFHYHNHAFEFEKFGNEIGYDILINETDSNLWGFILDTYWVQFGGFNPVNIIKKLSGRIDFCHFKDMQIKNDKQIMAAVMTGNLAFDEIIDVCKKTNIKYAMVEQDNCNGENPFDMLKLSFDNLVKAGC